MEVEERKTQHQSKFDGETYYFCSEDCKTEFDIAPEDYIGGEETRQTGT